MHNEYCNIGTIYRKRNSNLFVVEHIVTEEENKQEYFTDRQQIPCHAISAIAERGYNGKYGFCQGVESMNLSGALVHLTNDSEGQLFYIFYKKV